MEEESESNELQPWLEKYRPQKLDEVIGQPQAVERMKAFLKGKNIPHMLLAGPAGVGKTTTVLALARELYGEAIGQCFMELNASVTPETPILVRRAGRTERTNFGALADSYFFEGAGKYVYPTDLEILSIENESYGVCYKPVSNISRHKVSKVVRIKYEGGEVRTSLDHSVMVIGATGELQTKAAGDIRAGESLISFTAPLEGSKVNLNFEKFGPVDWRHKNSGKFRGTLGIKELDTDLSWLFGMYTAEGCATLSPTGTSGVSIFTHAYPQEEEVANAVSSVIKSQFGLETKRIISSSGFDRSRFSSVQVRAFNTQLAKFFLNHFYDAESPQANAHSKRVPSFLFSCPPYHKEHFLKGYAGDAAGSWGELLRYSSVSQENLIDVAWLARLADIDSSLYQKEARLVWKLPSYSYVKSELVDFTPIASYLSKHSKENWRYAMRHQLYSKKSRRVSKSKALFIVSKTNSSEEKEKLMRLLLSPFYSTEVKEITVEEYDGFVYDVSVPGSQVFWGGSTPILLHNSDERGIDVVRGRVKDFARTMPISDVPYRLILLDEADSLTDDAQHALRRTMEKYSENTRFALSCNFSSKIIEPIQSRCAIFRFRPLESESVKKIIEKIAAIEKITLSEKALEALVYVADGDARRATNLLQGASALSKDVKEEDVLSLSSRARPKEIAEMLAAALKGNFSEARKQLDELMVKYGMSGEDVISQVYREVTALPIPDAKKVEIVDHIGEYDFRISQGADPRIQLEAMIARIILVGSKP